MPVGRGWRQRSVWSLPEEGSCSRCSPRAPSHGGPLQPLPGCSLGGQGQAQEPGSHRGALGEGETRPLTLPSTHLPPVPSPPSWAPGWTSTQRTWSSAKLSRRVRSWDGKKEHMRRGGCWVPEGRGSKPDARPGARTNLGPHRQGTTSGKESCCGSGAGSFQAGRGLLCRGRAQGKAVTRDLLPPAALSPAPVPALNQLQS
jgi:hypothetical protein